MLTGSTEDPALVQERTGFTQQTEEKLLIGGLGGGGIVTMGDILARATINHYQHVIWFPCYNTMVRGGDSECCLILSENTIPSPLVYRCTTVIVMGATQVAAFEDRVERSGLMIVESTGLGDEQRVTREDIRVEYVPATEIARQLGNSKNANLVMMGAYIELTKTIPPDLVEAEIERSFQLKGLSQSKVTDGKEAFVKGMSLAAGDTQ